jgi:PTH2 family peptidyl-tRNA hydrolase
MAEYKQVVVLRKDLNMRKGKMVAQGGHAIVGAILKHAFKRELYAIVSDVDNRDVYKGRDIECLCIPLTDDIKYWLEEHFTKIALGVETEAELLEIYEKAQAAGIRAYLITDSGHTEFKMVPTNTAVAIGPDLVEKINPITGHLKPI